MNAAVDSKPKVGRPRTPKDLAERTELVRIATLAHQVLVSMRRQGRGMYDSERDLRSWLNEDEVAYSSSDLVPALALLEACSKIGRSAAKANSPRSGWLLSVNGKEPVSGPESVSEPVEGPAGVVSEAVGIAPGPAEGAPEPVVGAADDERINALARAIVAAFYVSGRGHSGNRFLCESEAVLREYLHANGVSFGDELLAAALRVLETGTLQGSDARLIRGTELHRLVNRSVHTRATPLPPRAMLLSQIHAFDFREYEPADIEPYLLPVGAE